MRQVRRVVVVQSHQLLLEDLTPRSDTDAAFHQEAPTLIDQPRPLGHQTLAIAVQSLTAKLLLRFERNEGHRRKGSGLGDRLCITVIILVNLDVGSDVKRLHQSRLMTVFKEKSTDMMRPPLASTATPQAVKFS